MKFLSLFFVLFVSGCLTGNVVLKFEDSGKVTKVVDGDTLDLENGERIRFSGINTPETGECYYEEAKVKLNELVMGKKIFLEKDKSDVGKYGRKLRYVYLNTTKFVFVNGILVEQGYARVYDKYKSDTKRYVELKELEKKAKEKKLGVWGCVDLKEKCLFVGSKNSEKYHTPSCKYAKKIKEENLICYKSQSETKGKEFSGC
jgi:micrococcal nuclease